MIHCMTMDQLNDSGRQWPQTKFCQITFQTQNLGEVRHREIAHDVGTCPMGHEVTQHWNHQHQISLDQ